MSWACLASLGRASLAQSKDQNEAQTTPRIPDQGKYKLYFSLSGIIRISRADLKYNISPARDKIEAGCRNDTPILKDGFVG